MKKTFIFICSILVYVYIISGCTSFSLIRPVYPPVGNPNHNPDEVQSLQPTLQWEKSDLPDVSYDLIVYEIIKEESFWEGTKRFVGDTVYYKEDIRETSHRIEIQLKPESEYCWSVRIRRGDNVTGWSSYDYDLFLLLSYIRVEDTMFRFLTPRK